MLVKPNMQGLLTKLFVTLCLWRLALISSLMLLLLLTMALSVCEAVLTFFLEVLAGLITFLWRFRTAPVRNPLGVM